MTRGTAGNTWIKFELPVELKERFLAACAKTRFSQSEILRTFIDEWTREVLENEG